MVMKMENKPMLFVNTISDVNLDQENKLFDSRKKEGIKTHIKHRSDDIKAIMASNKKVYVCISLGEEIILGEVKNISNILLDINTNFGPRSIELKKIDDLKIEKITP